MASKAASSQSILFGPDRPKVWTIPPGTDFLGGLANTLADAFDLVKNPAALADALIYVPNRRSARALALACYRAAGKKVILPPDIRALGDLEIDEPPSGAEEALTDLGPPLSGAKRLGTLAMLVAAYYKQEQIDIPPASSIAAARELAGLLDSAALSGDIDWDQLPELVNDTDLAKHWQQSVKFLKIITDNWPDWLADNGATEPFARRLIVAEAIAASLMIAPPSTPFIVAGSTGATPASRALMQAATQLPQGLVVLPGLDLGAPASMWEEISPGRDEHFSGAPDHPQFSLAGTLNTLGLTAADIPVWPGGEDIPSAEARQRLIYESLAPAQQTADWLNRLKSIALPDSEPDFAAKALTGLSLIEAEDEANEALLAALLLREALETPGQTAALVTPDAALGRQVSAILKRWDVVAPPSGGLPLGRTRAGSLVLLALDWASDTGHPVRLTSLLKHAMLSFDAATISTLEKYFLRGPRRWTDLESLANFVATATLYRAPPEAAKSLSLDLLQRLQIIASGAAIFADPQALTTGSDAVEHLINLINAVVGDETSAWSGRDGEAASKCLESIAEITAPMEALTVQAFIDIVASVAGSATVQSNDIPHPRLNIWGPLEARLQRADKIILAGLNEGIWPDRPAADAFLPRRFRAPLGLPAPEARLGLAAHDFAQLAVAPDVVMLYAARRDDAPAVPSRWIMRLKTLSEGALGKSGAAQALAPVPDRDPRHWARALTEDRLASPVRSAKPRPTPPVNTRPKQLSVTQIDTLQRDPYAIYARHILKLNRLDPLNAPVDARPRGTAIHKALEDFDTALPEMQTADALHTAFLGELRAAGEPAHKILADRASLKTTAIEYLRWWGVRQDTIKAVWPEVGGAITLDIAGDPFKLTGIADRLELNNDGTYTIIDFKTGDGKTRKQIDSGFEQQLPFLALIARDGVINDTSDKTIAAASVSAFGYVSVRVRFEAAPITKDAEDANALTDASRDILTKLIAQYRQADAPYLSVPRIAVRSKYDGDYDRLARRAEWARDISQGET